MQELTAGQQHGLPSKMEKIAQHPGNSSCRHWATLCQCALAGKVILGLWESLGQLGKVHPCCWPWKLEEASLFSLLLHSSQPEEWDLTSGCRSVTHMSSSPPRFLPVSTDTSCTLHALCGAAAASLVPMSALLGEENSPWVPVCVGRHFTPLTEERPTSLWDSCPIFLWQKSGFISILFSLPSSLRSRVMLSLQPVACCSHELAFAVEKSCYWSQAPGMSSCTPGGELVDPSLAEDAELLKFMKDDIAVIVPSCLL